jgi:hypothetical protein
MTEYNNWIIGIFNNGFTPNALGQYSEMLGYFYIYSTYKGGILSSLSTPTAIIKSKNGCY